MVAHLAGLHPLREYPDSDAVLAATLAIAHSLPAVMLAPYATADYQQRAKTTAPLQKAAEAHGQEVKAAQLLAACGR